MSSSPLAQPSRSTHDTTETALTQYGIVRVPVDIFHYGGYCYTNVEDAIAEAKRHPGRTSVGDTQPVLDLSVSR